MKRSIQTWKESNPKLLATAAQSLKTINFPPDFSGRTQPITIDVQILDNPQINFRRKRDFPKFDTPSALINDFKNAVNATGISTMFSSMIPDLSSFKLT
jgi:hypothetical protein